MEAIAALVTAVAALVVALGVLYLIMKISKVADAMIEYMRKDKQ
ncbi:MAG: hypothetical protein AAGB97_08905 [Dehalococcoidia bacterium]|nr:hypothetical protein [Chloroflexota bacterium]MBT9161137.1 hypothetical protein [Chloroflexota bacterium]MBT9163002.1 hypothetical protein [Chloroflexota bacterium]